MRIGLVIYGDLNTLSGGYRYDRRLVEHLRRAGDEVQVISLPETGYWKHALNSLRGRPIASIAKSKYDLLLVDELCHPSFVVGLRDWAVNRPTPVVALVHHLLSDEPGPGGKKAAQRMLERRFLRQVQGWLANTGVTLGRVREVAGVERPGEVALPGREPGEEGPAAGGDRGGPVRVLLVGNVTRRKGVLELLEALRGLEDWRLEIVGRTDMEPGYVRRVRHRLEADPHLRPRVELTGPLEGAGLERRYREADLFAMPSHYEGFGMAYLEAMGHGLPVVASSAGGAREIVRDGVNGRLVDPGDASGLREALEALIGDAALRNRMGDEALRTWRSHPTWDESFGRARAFLHAMTGSRADD